MAISAGGPFISGATSTGLCSGPFTLDLYTTTLPLIVGSDLFLDSGGTTNPPDPGYYSNGTNTYYYKGRVIDEIIPCTTPTPTPTPTITTTTTTLPPVDYFVGCGEVVECDNGFVEFGPSDDPDDIFDNWYRFAFFAPANILDLTIGPPYPTKPSGLQPDGTIITNNPAFFFYTGVTNTDYLGEFNLPMTEGENVGPSPAVSNRFYYNTAINKFVTAYPSGGSSALWTTFNPTVNVSIPLGNPTAAQNLTTSLQWSTTNLTSTQYTVSGSSNTVVLASNKINDAGGVPKMIQCNLNSALVNGFYSICGYNDYTHEITIGSFNGDDDVIGIVLAATKGLGTNPEVTDTLSLIFNGSSSGTTGIAQIVYNYGQEVYAFNDGSSIASLVMSNVPSPFGNGGYSNKGQVRVRIVKTGSIFEIYTTSRMGTPLGAIQPGQPNPYTLLFQFDLSDKNTWTGAPSYAVGDELLKFVGQSRIGYLTFSQRQTYFYDIKLDSFQQPLNSLFSDTTSGVILGNVYTFEEVSGCWVYSGLTSNYLTLTNLTVESEFNDCDVCVDVPPQECPFESYCVSTGNFLYDDTYYSAGTYNDQSYWTGGTNGWYIFLSESENCWCLSSELGDPCVLFGPTPCNNDCPDLCDGFFSPGVCPVPTPTPTSYCQTISFDAIFECDLPITPTPTPTPTKTLTPTPTPTATELCGGRGMTISVMTFTPTPTPTATGGKMVPTPTASPQYNCNFDGSVVFNTFDDYIRCNGSKRFKDCTSGMLYHTTDVVLDPLGGTPAEGYVYQSFVDGISTCISYEGFVSSVAGVNTIQLTQILGELSNGACSQCVILNTPTPTPTLTSTPTPTASSPLPTCNSYLIENNYINTQTFTYRSCDTGLIVDGVINGYGSITICSPTTPTTTSSFITITSIGLCN